MKIQRDGTIVLPKKGKNEAMLNDLADTLALHLLHRGAIVKVLETDNAVNVMVEHGQVTTPKDVNTKMKVGSTEMLKFYCAYDAI